MRSSEIRNVSALTVVLLGAVLLVSANSQKMKVPVIDTADGRSADGQEAITFWYTDADDRAFFETCADDFLNKTGIAVNLEEQPSLNYFSEIYEAVKNDTDMPDAYLLEADELEKAYLCQLTEPLQAENEYTQRVLPQALDAGMKNGKLYGYPLYGNTVIFAYRTDYFETPPKSVQEMLDYSVEHEPGEGVEKLLEWNLADGFYNYPFFGAAVDFKQDEAGTMTVTYQEETKAACTDFFANLTAVIALDENTIGRKSVVDDFQNGKTVAVFADSDDIGKLTGASMQIGTLPALKEDLPMVPAAKTTLLCVNGMSEEKERAAEFAEFVVTQEMGHLTKLTDHVPMSEALLSSEEQSVAYRQYEQAKAKPDALNATDFWVKFQNEALQIWTDAE